MEALDHVHETAQNYRSVHQLCIFVASIKQQHAKPT